jgi:hypothetical protein
MPGALLWHRAVVWPYSFHRQATIGSKFNPFAPARAGKGKRCWSIDERVSGVLLVRMEPISYQFFRSWTVFHGISLSKRPRSS